MAKLWIPDHRFAAVTEITLPWLVERDLRGLLLDVDSTLKAYRQQEIPPGVQAWLQMLREAEIACCLVSNGCGGRIRHIAGELELPFVAPAWKPFPFGCRRGLRVLGTASQETAMVGDQVFADVWAGNWAGLTTILVSPFHPEQEGPFTRLKRPLERCWLRRIDPQSGQDQQG